MTSNYPSGYYSVPPQSPLPPYGSPAPQMEQMDTPRNPWRRDGRSLLSGFLAGVLAAGLAFGGYAVANSNSPATTGAGSVQALPSIPKIPGIPNLQLPNGLGPLPGSGSGSQSGNLKAATGQQKIGIVTVNSVLKYQNAESAGTGMILTSDGEVLTNNHVIDGATRIVVTVQSTGRSYPASVVGTAPGRDVAVLKLQGASGLPTARLASSSNLAVGSTVTGVGNAGGTGRLTQVTGRVTGLDKSITASDDSGANSERLRGLIQTNAAIISGDSGGPLYNAAGQVVGMDTAASPSSARESAYAIPITDAVSVVRQIDTGVETSAIHIGLPGFLGISVTNSHGGVGVQGLLGGGPAASAGIRPGSVITAVDGTPVHSATALHNLLSAKGPGAQVTVRWTDRAGQPHAATVTLATGPAD